MNLARALMAHRQGNLPEAEAIYVEILKRDPTDFNSMHLLGVIALQTGRTEQGIELIQNAISINENVAEAHSNLGNGLRDLKLIDEALISYDRAIALKPDHADAFNNRGIVLSELKRLEEALTSFDQAIALQPGYSEAYRNRGDVLRALDRPLEALTSFDKAVALLSNNAEVYVGRANALMDLKRFEEALASYDKAIALRPHSAGAYGNRGIALFELKRSEEALASYDRAIELKLEHAEAFNNRGNALRALKRNEEALANYDKAITLNPGYSKAYKNRGNALWELRRPQEALENYDKSIALKPDQADVYNNRGIALWDLKRLGEALESFDKSITLSPHNSEAFNNRGTALLDLDRPDEALASFDKAIALRPDYADAYRNRCNVLAVLKQYDEAFVSYDKLFGLEPGIMGLEGDRLHIKMQLCNWSNIESESAHLIRSVKKGFVASQPFFFLAAPSSSKDQLECSRSWVSHNFPPFEIRISEKERCDNARIRIAYVSADFRDHPMSYLTAGLFECHDKSRFETTAISIGPDDGSDIRSRLKAAFDRFVDAKAYSDEQIANLVKALKIDILVDLMGFTTHARTAIFARRSAPIQVNYLGYPGTMGAPYIDYIIADRTVISKSQRRFYSENVVVMPNSYFVNDFKRPITNREFTREEMDLPSTGFVFCCFNNNYKITSHVFDSWMRILKRVPDSVLWLLENNEKATSNLRKEAIERGVGASRLIFAKRMPPADHLARHRAANLCLDTLPYNAHTTATDTLWAGTPLVTCIGRTFAGRVAASLLYALRLPELVTFGLKEYEELAIDLATHTERLVGINRRLAENRLATPLFDTGTFAKHIEVAFTEMVARQRAGSAPSDILVST
jgi:protein O-GlcNAc transferase